MKTLEERFFSKVHINTKSGCWEWTAYRNKCGYGVFSIKRKFILAHRAAYQMTGKEIKSGYCICHTCDNPSCVNPYHLFAGTHSQNMKDMSNKKRSPYGEMQPSSKLDEKTVVLIRKFVQRNGWGRANFLVRWLGVSSGVISQVKNRQIWKHVS